MTDSRTEAGNTQNKPGAPYDTRRKTLTMMGICQRDTGTKQKSCQYTKLEKFEQQNK